MMFLTKLQAKSTILIDIVQYFKYNTKILTLLLYNT